MRCMMISIPFLGMFHQEKTNDHGNSLVEIFIESWEMTNIWEKAFPGKE